MSLPIAFQIILGLLPAVGFMAGYFLGRSAPRDGATRQIDVIVTGEFTGDAFKANVQEFPK